MALVGTQRASELTGKSKSTIQRAMNSGKLSYEIDQNGRKVIDVAELERAFGIVNTSTTNQGSADNETQSEDSMKRMSEMLEAERMKMKIKLLEEQLDEARSQIDDMKEQRNQWQKQAQQVLITSQYSNKRAEELQKEIKLIEQKEIERKRHLAEHRMKKMQSDNQNTVMTAKSGSNNGLSDSPEGMKNIWEKIKRAASS